MAVTCEVCHAPTVKCTIITESRVDAELSDGTTFLIYPEDIQRPESLEVYVTCTSCSHNRLLLREEWEVA